MFRSFFEGFKVPVKLYWDTVYENIMQARITYTQLSIDYWLTHVYGRWQWWFLLFWTIFPLFIWWKYTDRNRFLEISLFGVITSISAGILDAAGVFMGQWTYPYSLLPFLPNFFPIDYVIIPVMFMLLYQKYAGWKDYIIACVILSSFVSLILDPIIVAVNIYQPLLWQYIYSVPVFVFMASFAKWLTMVITSCDYKYRRSHPEN